MRLLSRKPQPVPCRLVVELATAYLEDTLPAGDRRRLDAHLAACADCAGYLEQLRATIAVAGRIEPEDLSPEAHEALSGVFRAWSAGA